MLLCLRSVVTDAAIHSKKNELVGDPIDWWPRRLNRGSHIYMYDIIPFYSQVLR